MRRAAALVRAVTKCRVVVGSVGFGLVELPKPNVTEEGFVTGLVEVGGRRGPQLQLGHFWNQ